MKRKIPALLLAGQMVIAGVSHASDAPGAVRSFRPWDLSYILPLQVDAETLGLMTQLTELGYSPAEIKAMIDHLSQKWVLPESLAADSDALSDVIAGKKRRGGPLNDRSPHQSFSPPTVFSILDEAKRDATACFEDPANWRAAQLRIIPSRIQPPGSPNVYLDWAQTKKLPIDRIFQMRITFRPFCPVAVPTADEPARILFEPLDTAMHFAFELHPNDATLLKDPAYRALIANPGQLNSDVWGNSGRFVDLSRNGDPQAMGFLESHLHALNGPDYLKFRHYVLQDVAAIAALRTQLPAHAFDDLNTTSDELRDLNARTSAKFGSSFPSLAHPGFKTQALSEQYYSRFKNFAVKYGTRGNVTAIAGFVTEAGATAYFSNFGMGRYGNLSNPQTPKEAVAEYSLVRPNSMDTSAAQLVRNGTLIQLVSLKTANFYAAADAIGNTTAKGFAFRLSNPNVAQSLVDGVDFYSPLKIIPDGGGNQHVSYARLFPDHGTELQSQVAKFADPARTLPSTTSCVSCHLLPRVALETEGDGSSIKLMNAPVGRFMLLNETSMTARSVHELDREFTRLNLEWVGSPLQSCESKGLRQCLDESESQSCIEKFCK